MLRRSRGKRKMQKMQASRMAGKEELLWWRVVDEFDALLDIALQARLAGFEELLLVGADVAEDVVRLLRTRGLRSISAAS